MSTLPVDILERDFKRELHGALLGRRFERWRQSEPALAPFPDARALLRFLRAGASSPAKDAVLCALLRLGREDPLAARVVLQALLPALKRRVGGVLIDASEREELWSAVLDRLWVRIRAYPVGRLPHRVAANLALSVMRDAFRGLERDRARARHATGEALPESTDRGPQEGDIDALVQRAVGDGAITGAEACLIVRTRIDGVSLAEYASAAGGGYDALRIARRRAERRLLLYLGARDVRSRMFGSGGRFGLSLVLGSPGAVKTDRPGEKTNRDHPRR